MKCLSLTISVLTLTLSLSRIGQAQSTLYWTDSNAWSIQSMNLADGTTEDILTATLRSPQAIAVDQDGGKMYWAGQENRGKTIIRSANLDGSQIEDLPGTETDSPGDLVLDAARGWLYWTGDDAIQRIRLDGSSRGVLRDSVKAGALALDLNDDKIYWTSTDGPLNGRIYRAELDGSDAELLQETYPQEPRGLALDPLNGKMYWTFNGLLMQADLDGSNRRVVSLGDTPKGADRLTIDAEHGIIYVNASVWDNGRQFVRVYQHNLNDGTTTTLPIDDSLYPTRIATTGSDLYWTDSINGRIQRLNLGSNNVDELIVSPMREPRHMSVDVESRKVYWTESHTIQRADFDGTGIEVLARPVRSTFPDPSITDLALDLTNQKIYWTLWSGWGPHHDGGIYRSNLDGSAIDSLYRRAVSGIALDPEAGTMYFDDIYFDDDHGLTQADLDGSNLTTFDSSLTEYDHARVHHPIALDLESDFIFFTRRDGIWRVNTDGSNPAHFVSRTSLVTSLAVDSTERKLYWTETGVTIRGQSESRIKRVNLDGSDIEDVLVSEDANYSDLSVNSESSNATAVTREQPQGFSLQAAYPNPFNPTTSIQYTLASTERISIKVRDAQGRLVAVLADDIRPAGLHRVVWAVDKDTPSGVYFYTLETGSGTVTRSMLLLK